MQAAARSAIFSSKRSSARFPQSSRVPIDVSSEVHGSNIWRRGWSLAASVPSESSKSQKTPRRVPIHERRAMVESFVHKYRISNAGKFPTATVAQKQVGGSYYVIRQILQEIQYEFRLSNVNKKDKFQIETTEEIILPLFGAKEYSQESTAQEEVSNFVTTDSSASPISGLVGMENSNIKITKYPKTDETLITKHEEAREYFDAKEKSKLSNQDEELMVEETSGHDTIIAIPFSKSTMNNEETPSNKGQMSTDESFQDNYVVSTRDQVFHSTTTEPQSHQIKLESEEVLQPPEETEGSEKDKSAIKGSDGLKGESVLKEVEEGPDSETGDRSKLPSEKEPIERSTVWGNLKSLADGIINFWRKL